MVLYTGPTKGNFYGATWAAPVFKRIADKIYASNPGWNAPLHASGMTPPDNPSIASGLAGAEGMPVDYLPMKSRPDTKGKGWISIDSGDETSSPLVSSLMIEKGIVPDVTDMGLKDALFLLENEGYQVSFSGSGRVVSQIPEAGTALAAGHKITLSLK